MLITSPTFISQHSNRSTSLSEKNCTHKFLITPMCMPLLTNSSSYSLICEDTKTNTCVVEESSLEIPFKLESESIRIIGSVNGLICLSDAYQERLGHGGFFHTHPFGRKICLWNPSVRKHRYIQYSPLLNQHPDLVRTYVVAGFGFHEPDNDYKIVRVFHTKDDTNNFFGKLEPKAEIYSLTNDSWTMVEGKVTRLADYRQCVLVNGAVYWSEEIKGSPPEWIISFDFKTEAFGQIHIPVQFENEDGSYWANQRVTLMEFKGLLSVCTLDKEDGGTKQYSAWVMEKSGWTKQLKIVLHLLPKRVSRPLMFTKSGQLVHEESFVDVKVLLDPETQEYINLGSAGPYTVDTSYMESLVMLEGGNARVRREKRGRG